MCTGMTDKVIEKIAKERATVSEESLLTLEVTSRIYCSEILSLVQEFNAQQ